MLDLDAPDGFEWDEGNLTKNWDSHRVSAAECEEAFFNIPLLLHDDIKHSMQERRFYIQGKTNIGCLLFIAFALRAAKIRVISARPMSWRERQIYEKANT
jgi:uncharacterized DUF497 family protein